LNLSSPSILLYPPPPFLEYFQQVSFFPFSYMCTQCLPHIHPLTPIPQLPRPPTLVPCALDRTCSALLFSNFAKGKKKKSHFCLR
jgi:hypothetical protein